MLLRNVDQASLEEKVLELELTSNRLERAEFRAATETRQRLDLEDNARRAAQREARPALTEATDSSSDKFMVNTSKANDNADKGHQPSPTERSHDKQQSSSARPGNHEPNEESNDRNNNYYSDDRSPLTLRQLMSTARKQPTVTATATAGPYHSDSDSVSRKPTGSDDSKAGVTANRKITNQQQQQQQQQASAPLVHTHIRAASQQRSGRERERDEEHSAVLDGSLFRRIRGTSPQRTFGRDAGNHSNSSNSKRSTPVSEPLMSVATMTTMISRQSNSNNTGAGVDSKVSLMKVASLLPSQTSDRPVIVSRAAVEADINSLQKVLSPAEISYLPSSAPPAAPSSSSAAISLTAVNEAHGSEDDNNSALRLSDLNISSLAHPGPDPAMSLSAAASNNTPASADASQASPRSFTSKEQYIKQWTDTTSARIERAIQMKGWKLTATATSSPASSPSSASSAAVISPTPQQMNDR